MPSVMLENIRSAYNVGNVIRTADALNFDVVLTGYTPSPFIKQKVKKTSLGAEENIDIYEFCDFQEAIEFAKRKYGFVVAAELTSSSRSLEYFNRVWGKKETDICVVFGNEVSGVMEESMQLVDEVFHIPMKGQKESLNVGQSSAIFMREIFRSIEN